MRNNRVVCCIFQVKFWKREWYTCMIIRPMYTTRLSDSGIYSWNTSKVYICTLLSRMYRNILLLKYQKKNYFIVVFKIQSSRIFFIHLHVAKELPCSENCWISRKNIQILKINMHGWMVEGKTAVPLVKVFVTCAENRRF